MLQKAVKVTNLKLLVNSKEAGLTAINGRHSLKGGPAKLQPTAPPTPKKNKIKRKRGLQED